MIEPALTYIKEELKTYLTGKIGNMDGDVRLDNIANYDTSNSSSDMVNKVIMSLVNVEEESTLKNNAFKRRNPILGTVDYIEPAVHINLYLLFTSTPAQSGSIYEKALIRLSHIIQFFQHQKRFETTTVINAEEYKIQLIFELYTLTFEQINHLWGSLGGKQVPFVMYKARLIKIQEPVSRPAVLIEEIQNNINNI